MKFTVHNTPKPKSCPEVMEKLFTVLEEARNKEMTFLAITYIVDDEDGGEETVDVFVLPEAELESCYQALDGLTERAENDLAEIDFGEWETGE